MYTLQDNYYLNVIYDKPRNRCVTFLVFAGISYNGNNSRYFTENMRMQYAQSFNIHQRPFKTKNIHYYFINKLPYFYYLWFVAAPIDLFIHTSQIFIGENGYFFENGMFFIPYLFLHE